MFKNAYNMTGESLLPHRPPFLFVDRLLEADETGALGEYTFTLEKNDFFKGHFPDFPVVPGVVLIEAMCQAAAAAVTARGVLGKQAAFAIAAIEESRFRRPVRPGETLRTVVKNIRERVPLGIYTFEGYVGEELACTARVKCMLMNGWKA